MCGIPVKTRDKNTFCAPRLGFVPLFGKNLENTSRAKFRVQGGTIPLPRVAHKVDFIHQAGFPKTPVMILILTIVVIITTMVILRTVLSVSI